MDWFTPVFYTLGYAAIAAVLLGLVALYQSFGFPAMYGAIFVIYLVYLALERRRPIYFDSDPLALGSNQVALPPPGKSALHPPGTRALTPTVRSGSGRKALPPR